MPGEYFSYFMDKMSPKSFKAYELVCEIMWLFILSVQHSVFEMNLLKIETDLHR